MSTPTQVRIPNATVEDVGGDVIFESANPNLGCRIPRWKLWATAEMVIMESRLPASTATRLSALNLLEFYDDEVERAEIFKFSSITPFELGVRYSKLKSAYMATNSPAQPPEAQDELILEHGRFIAAIFCSNKAFEKFFALIIAEFKAWEETRRAARSDDQAGEPEDSDEDEEDNNPTPFLKYASALVTGLSHAIRDRYEMVVALGASKSDSLSVSASIPALVTPPLGENTFDYKIMTWTQWAWIINNYADSTFFHLSLDRPTVKEVERWMSRREGLYPFQDYLSRTCRHGGCIHTISVHLLFGCIAGVLESRLSPADMLTFHAQSYRTWTPRELSPFDFDNPFTTAAPVLEGSGIMPNDLIFTEDVSDPEASISSGFEIDGLPCKYWTVKPREDQTPFARHLKTGVNAQKMSAIRELVTYLAAKNQSKAEEEEDQLVEMLTPA